MIKKTTRRERYWEAGQAPDSLLDWVSKNVVAATKDYWEDCDPAAWVDSKNGRMVFTVRGPGKPTAKDPSGQSDGYKLDLYLMALLKEYSAPYEDIGGPFSDDQREDLRNRAAALRKLSGDVAALAVRAEKWLKNEA
jgi:hypothetical protein